MYFFSEQFPNTFSFGNRPSAFDTTPAPYNVYFAEVCSVEDKDDGGRIYAKIPGIDAPSGSTTDISIRATPLLSRFINIMPQVNETVFIFIQDKNRQYGERFWMGPIISQPQFLSRDIYNGNSLSTTKYSSLRAPDTPPTKVATANGVYPKRDEIAFQGRDNSDILFRPRQVVIRAGKFDSIKTKDPKLNDGYIPDFNIKNPTYFKLAYNIPIENNNGAIVKGSAAAMVAEKLLLLTFGGRKNDFSEFKLAEPNVEISEKTILEILSKAEPAVYGYVLIEFLNLAKDYMANHVHPYPGRPPVQDEIVKRVLNFNLEKFLAKNIRLV